MPGLGYCHWKSTNYTLISLVTPPHTFKNSVHKLQLCRLLCSSSHTKAKNEAAVLRSAFCLSLFLQECWDASCSCLSGLSTHPATMLSSSTPPTSTGRWSRVTVCGWLSSTLPGKAPFWPLFSDLQGLHYSRRFSDGEPVTLQSVINTNWSLLFRLVFFVYIFSV